MEVRRGQESDIEWLLAELKSFGKFLGTTKQIHGDDDEYSRGLLATMLRDHLVFVAEREPGNRIGFIAGYTMPHMFNPKLRVLAEAWWWVIPEHRKSRAGLMLLDAYTKWGKEHCDWVTMCIETVTPINERCLTKRGYRLHERSYLLET